MTPRANERDGLILPHVRGVLGDCVAKRTAGEKRLRHSACGTKDVDVPDWTGFARGRRFGELS